MIDLVYTVIYILIGDCTKPMPYTNTIKLRLTIMNLLHLTTTQVGGRERSVHWLKWIGELNLRETLAGILLCAVSMDTDMCYIQN